MRSNSRIAMVAALMGSMGAMLSSDTSAEAILDRTPSRRLFNGSSYMGQALIGSKHVKKTTAQQKRAAKKARNVKRHRAACKA